MRLVGQLQIDDGDPLACQEAPGLTQSEAERRADIAAIIGENLLQQATGQDWKSVAFGANPRPRLGQGGLALDIGNDIPQRGKALLLVRGVHGATAM